MLNSDLDYCILFRIKSHKNVWLSTNLDCLENISENNEFKENSIITIENKKHIIKDIIIRNIDNKIKSVYKHGTNCKWLGGKNHISHYLFIIQVRVEPLPA